MPFGYTNQFLEVDLSARSIRTRVLPEETARLYLGGYGLGARYLYDHLPRASAPLSPDNLLGFVTGPLTGTPAIGGTRFTVVAKSPLTGGWGDANCGGNFGPVLKFAGFDALYFYGRADAPAYLWIRDGQAELRDASHLWGKDVAESAALLKAETGEKVQIACLGPAGERLALISGIMNGSRAAARSGVGAVMGSKNLKAVVVEGSRPVPIADPERSVVLRRELVAAIGGPWAQIWRRYGTCGALAGSVELGDAPVRNWGGGGLDDFPGAAKISDESVVQYQTRRYGCWRCPVACGGHVVLPEDPETKDNRKPEYETLASFGSLCLNDDLASIIRLNELCDLNGLDTISAGATVAFALECFEAGMLYPSEADGLELRWGNGPAMVALLEKMIRREGVGDLLADGVKVAAEKLGRGSEKFAMHIGGQEIPMHDPRLGMPFLLDYLLDATPSRHNQGSGALMDMPPAWVEKAHAGLSSQESYNGKTAEQFKLANLAHVINASGLCMFDVCSFTDRYILPEFFETIVGWQLTPEDIFRLGERIGTLRLAFNIREGVNPTAWRAPDRILGKPPLQIGPLKDRTLDVTAEMKDFRRHAGWDPETGVPEAGKLAELGLADVIPDLWPDRPGGIL